MLVMKLNQLKNFKSSEPCICCGHDVDNEVTYHHEYARGSHPELAYKKWNLIPLCFDHHNNWCHQKGTYETSLEFEDLHNWLIKNGWEILEMDGRKKWIHAQKD